MQNCRLLFKYKEKLKILIGSDILVRFKSTCSAWNQKKLTVLFFGTDQFSLRSLVLLNDSQKCSNSNIDQINVVTSFKAKANPIKQFAERNSIECYDWQSFVSNGTKIKYDLGVVVSFGHLIPEHVINLFPLGMINVHASLLPRWRGASPIIYAILNEDQTTGVTIMKIHPHKFDVGDIIAQKVIPIPKNVLMPELHQTLANEGAQLLLDCIHRVPDSLKSSRMQSDSNVTYAPRINDSMAEINWQTMTARHIYNLYKALYSFKWLITYWHKRRVKIREMDLNLHIKETNVYKQPGYIEYDKRNQCLRVHCNDGSSIFVKRLGIEGKKSDMSAADFNNGFLKKVDQTQRYFTNIVESD